MQLSVRKQYIANYFRNKYSFKHMISVLIFQKGKHGMHKMHKMVEMYFQKWHHLGGVNNVFTSHLFSRVIPTLFIALLFFWHKKGTHGHMHHMV